MLQDEGPANKRYHQPKGTRSQTFAILDSDGMVLSIAHQYQHRDGTRTPLDPKQMYRDLTTYEC